MSTNAQAKLMSRKALIRALEGAELYSDEIAANLLVTTLVAHQRAGHVSVKHAAAACRMTEDDFIRSFTIVDNEARRMLDAALPSTPDHGPDSPLEPAPAPAGA